jgi:hypothetical protein
MQCVEIYINIGVMALEMHAHDDLGLARSIDTVEFVELGIVVGCREEELQLACDP